MPFKTPNKLATVGLWRRLILDFRLLFSLMKDYWKGNYRNVSIRSILVFFIGIIYILFPMDILPDAIPFIGQIDDAAILIFCMYLMEKDLYQYQAWKAFHHDG